MKQIFKYILPAVTAALTMSSCGQEDIEPKTDRDYPTFSAIIDGAHTRATDDYWERGDQIGINYGTSIYNICHLSESGNGSFTVKEPKEQFYFHGTDNVEFTAYYPYNRNATTGLIGISTADQSNQKNFDFLWASGIGSRSYPDVELTFVHKMSKVTFVFENGDNMDVSSINKIRLNGLVEEGTFDTTTGICKINEDSPTALTTMPLTDVKAQESVTPFFLFPQTVTGAVKLEIYDSNSQYFVCNLTVPDNELLAGTNYTYTITVSKTGLKVTGATLSDWITTNGENSEASSADD